MIQLSRIDPKKPLLYLELDGVIVHPGSVPMEPIEGAIDELNRFILGNKHDIVISSRRRLTQRLDSMVNELGDIGVTGFDVVGVTGSDSSSRDAEIMGHLISNNVISYKVLDSHEVTIPHSVVVKNGLDEAAAKRLASIRS